MRETVAPLSRSDEQTAGGEASVSNPRRTPLDAFVRAAASALRAGDDAATRLLVQLCQDAGLRRAALFKAITPDCANLAQQIVSANAAYVDDALVTALLAPPPVDVDVDAGGKDDASGDDTNTNTNNDSNNNNNTVTAWTALVLCAEAEATSLVDALMSADSRLSAAALSVEVFGLAPARAGVTRRLLERLGGAVAIGPALCDALVALGRDGHSPLSRLIVEVVRHEEDSDSGSSDSSDSGDESSSSLGNLCETLLDVAALKNRCLVLDFFRPKYVELATTFVTGMHETGAVIQPELQAALVAVTADGHSPLSRLMQEDDTPCGTLIDAIWANVPDLRKRALQAALARSSCVSFRPLRISPSFIHISDRSPRNARDG